MVSHWLCAIALALFVPLACKRSPAPSGTGAAASAARPFDPTHPVSLRDDRGVAVTLRGEPQRIIALLPSHTETLFALGVGDRVVGVDDFSDYPPQVARLPKLGGLYDAHLETVLSLGPDLVLLSESSAAASAIEHSGLTVWAGSARTFDDVFRVIAAIGQLVGRSARATELSRQIEEDVIDVERRVRGHEAVRVYYELDANLYTVAPTSFIGVMLTKAGGRNIVPEGLGDFPKISPEVVIHADPSVILGASLDNVARRPGWTAIDAVRTARVYKLPKEESRLGVCPGPRIAKGLRALALRLHPELSL